MNKSSIVKCEELFLLYSKLVEDEEIVFQCDVYFVRLNKSECFLVIHKHNKLLQ